MSESRIISFDEWLESDPVTPVERASPLWTVASYRLSTYLFEVVWPDVTQLSRYTATRKVAGQLYRAVGSIGANISEGYSRSSHRDRAHIYEYSLGSSREANHWLRGALPVIGRERHEAHVETIARINQLVATTIPNERRLAGRR